MALKTWTQILALYEGDTVRQNIAEQIYDETPDGFSDSGRVELYEEARVRAFVEAHLPPTKPLPSILIPAATASGDKATLQAAGAAKIAARRGIDAGAVVALLGEYPDPVAAGDGAWWHVSRACRMFGADIPADSYVYSRSFVEMREAGHTHLS